MNIHVGDLVVANVVVCAWYDPMNWPEALSARMMWDGMIPSHDWPDQGRIFIVLHDPTSGRCVEGIHRGSWCLMSMERRILTCSQERFKRVFGVP